MVDTAGTNEGTTNSEEETGAVSFTEYKPQTARQRPSRAGARGRARKEANSADAETDENLTFRVEEKTSEVRKEPAPAITPEKAFSFAETDVIVGMLLGMCNGFAVGQYGPDAAINSQEKMLIESGLKNTISKLAPAQAAKIVSFMGPFSIVAGFGIWYARITKLNRGPSSSQAQTDAANSSNIANAASQLPQEQIRVTPARSAVRDAGADTVVAPPAAITERLSTVTAPNGIGDFRL